MTRASLDVVDRIGAHFGLDPLGIGRPYVFDTAIRAALVFTTPGALVELVADLGPLDGTRQPWGVVLHRLRRVPELVTAHHWAQEDREEVVPADRTCVERDPVCVTREPVDDGVDWGALGAFA